jgi:hypothetical protein
MAERETRLQAAFKSLQLSEADGRTGNKIAGGF